MDEMIINVLVIHANMVIPEKYIIFPKLMFHGNVPDNRNVGQKNLI